MNVNQNQFIPGAERRTPVLRLPRVRTTARAARRTRPASPRLASPRRALPPFSRAVASGPAGPSGRRPTRTRRRPPGVRRRCLGTRPPWRAPATAAAGTTIQEGSSWRIATRRARSSARARTESSSRPSTPRSHLSPAPIS